MSGTHVAYAATICRAMSGTALGYAAAMCYAKSGTDLCYAATIGYAKSGTELAYAATRSRRLRWRRSCLRRGGVRSLSSYPRPSTDITYDATANTDVVYDDIGLRVCYAMSGTELAYDAIGHGRYGPTRMRCALRYCDSVWSCEHTVQCAVLKKDLVLRTCYAQSGTEIAYAATRPRYRKGWSRL
eukprot:2539626-Rhodomonas_salina.1